MHSTGNNWRTILKPITSYSALTSLITKVCFILFSINTTSYANSCEEQGCSSNKKAAVSLVVTPDKDYAGKQSSIIVSDAYIREMPPGQTISASFMMLENNSDTDVSLYKVNSDIAKQVELHQHTEVDGIMEMRRVKKITIPAKGEIVLKPGGYHMMLFGIKKGMKSGDSVELKLSFDNGTEQTVKVVVMDIMQAMNLNKKIN